MEIVVNGETRCVPGELTISRLLAHLGVPAERVAVELNRGIVRRDDWQATRIAPGSQVEVVMFVGGG